MAEQTGFAVVGLGMGRHHCKAIDAAPGARLVAVCDTDAERLEPTASIYGCKAYTDFADLLHAVAAIDGIERIRYTTSHPLEFSDAIIQAHAEIPKLVKYLHLPVQSGSDAVLDQMKRGYTADHFRERIAKLREVRPDISLSTDIIVGHPGEGAEEFEQTMQLVEDIGFDAAFSFVYSKRPGTPAADIADDTSRECKKERLARLQARIVTAALRQAGQLPRS